MNFPISLDEIQFTEAIIHVYCSVPGNKMLSIHSLLMSTNYKTHGTLTKQ
jgi:hypothetical protein